MGHFPNLTLQAVDTLINRHFLWIFHVSMWVDQISPRGWSKSRGSARPLLNNPSAPKRPWIKPGQVTKQTFFQSSLSWKGPVSPTQWNIISGLSFKPSPWSSLQVHWQSMERLAKGRWLCSPSTSSFEEVGWWCYITWTRPDSSRVQRRAKYLNVFNMQQTERIIYDWPYVELFRHWQIDNTLMSQYCLDFL